MIKKQLQSDKGKGHAAKAPSCKLGADFSIASICKVMVLKLV